ncbi:MAG: phage/plasmid primase, P4 family [Chitinophagales bacterium]
MKEETLNPTELQSKSILKSFTLTPEKIKAFGGKKTTEQIFEDLLSEIKELDFSDYLKLPKGSNTRQKHLIVGVVKRLLEVAKDNRWNLAKVYDYIYMFNGCYWQQLEKDELKSILGKAAILMGVPEYDAIFVDFKDKLLKQFLSDAHFTPPKPNPESILINLANGTFEFSPSGGKLREFDPKDFLTNQLPFEYDPDANCPMFDQFITKVLPDEGCRMVLQEFSGYIFSNLNLEKMLIITGNGSNGKSVFFNIICALVGKDNLLNYSVGLFNHEYNRAKLLGKILNYSSEKGEDLYPDILKTLISREPIQAREPYGKSFNMVIPTKFIMNANLLPQITEHTDAFFRRQCVIRFGAKITDQEKDIQLADKIINNELPGVFNWLLVGLNRLQKQQDFTYSEIIEQEIAEFRKQSDSVALFIEEKGYISTISNRIAISDLYKEYKSFCLDDGYKALGKNNFSIRLKNLGFEPKRSNSGAGFYMDIDHSRD